MMKREIKTKVELYNDNFENFKRYNIPKAQLIIADIPYNIGNNFYASRSDWYVGGDEGDTLVKAKLIVDYKLDGDAEDENTK